MGGAGLGWAAAREPAVYRSETQLTVSFEPAPGSSPTASRLMQRRVKTYAGLLTTTGFAAPVIDALRLPYPPERLAGSVVAWSPLNTHEINLAVTDRVPARAAAIADALAAELARVAGGDRPEPDLPAASVVTQPRPAPVPRTPVPGRWPWHALAGTLAGFSVGVGIAALREGARRADAGRGEPAGAADTMVEIRDPGHPPDLGTPSS